MQKYFLITMYNYILHMISRCYFRNKYYHTKMLYIRYNKIKKEGRKVMYGGLRVVVSKSKKKSQKLDWIKFYCYM